jgi:hypothetical protein
MGTGSKRRGHVTARLKALRTAKETVQIHIPGAPEYSEGEGRQRSLGHERCAPATKSPSIILAVTPLWSSTKRSEVIDKPLFREDQSVLKKSLPGSSAVPRSAFSAPKWGVSGVFEAESRARGRPRRVFQQPDTLSAVGRIEVTHSLCADLQNMASCQRVIANSLGEAGKETGTWPGD